MGPYYLFKVYAKCVVVFCLYDTAFRFMKLHFSEFPSGKVWKQS